MEPISVYGVKGYLRKIWKNIWLQRVFPEKYKDALKEKRLRVRFAVPRITATGVYYVDYTNLIKGDHINYIMVSLLQDAGKRVYLKACVVTGGYKINAKPWGRYIQRWKKEHALGRWLIIKQATPIAPQRKIWDRPIKPKLIFKNIFQENVVTYFNIACVCLCISFYDRSILQIYLNKCR